MIQNKIQTERKAIHFDGTQVKSLSYLVPHLKGCRKVLDFGCGSGNLLHLCKLHNIAAAGYDTNPHAVAECLERGFICYEELPDLSEFDGLTMVCVAEHLQPEFLWKVLSSFEGTIALQCDEPRPVITPWQLKKTSFWDDFEHVRPYTPIALKTMLESFGYSISASGWVKPKGSIKRIPSWIANKYLDIYARFTGVRSTHYAIGVR